MADGRETGSIVFVEDLPEASSLVGDHASGTSVLSVADGRVFGEAGVCRVGDVDYDYERLDDTLTVSPGLVAALSDGEPVARVGPEGQVEARKVVHLDFDGDSDVDSEAEVRSSDRAYFPDGDALAGAEVDVVDTVYGYETVSRPYNQPVFDAAAIDPTTFRSIIIAEGPVASVSTGFSGTSLPSGWSSTKTGPGGVGVGGASVPGASVVSSGPSGQAGSALLLDMGAAGGSGSAFDAAGEVATSLPETANAQITVRYKTQVSGDAFAPDVARLAIRRQDGPAWGDDWDAITLDLTLFDIRSVANGSTTVLTTIPVSSNPSTAWHWAQFRVSQGIISARIWLDGDDEPGWTSIPVSGVLSPGRASLIWYQSTFLSASRGQKLWIDSWDSTALSSGLTVEEDGSGSWRGQDLTHFEQRGAVSSGSFSAANTNQDVAVTFPRPFDLDPIITINPVNAAAAVGECFVHPRSITRTGFTARFLRKSGTASFTAHWSAGPIT